MHETAIAKKVLEDLERCTKGASIKSVLLEVGELANITGEELKETLQNMVNFDVEVEGEKAKVKCECGYEGPPKILERTHHSVIFTCPKCGSTPEIAKGGDIRITEVETED